MSIPIKYPKRLHKYSLKLTKVSTATTKHNERA